MKSISEYYIEFIIPYFVSLTHDVDLVMESAPIDMYWYREADRIAKQQQDELNWIAGMYVASAVGQVASGVLGKKSQYVKQPLLSKQKDEETEDAVMCEKFRAQYEIASMDLRKQGLAETFIDLSLGG